MYERNLKMIIKRRFLLPFLAWLLVARLGGIALPAVAAETDPAPAPLSVGDGLTRDSLNDFGAPEPAPAVAAVPVPSPTLQARLHSRAAYTRHRRTAHQPPAHRPIQVVKATPARRNLAVSFVYWWNGWVIRTFHTTNGTVMLKRVGAKA